MSALLLTLLACGGDQPLDQPNAPPPPPPMYGAVEADVARYTGLATEIHGPTRSFVLTGEGKRVIVMLAETATLRLGGMPSQVQDLTVGTTLYVEGRRDGDTLLVLRATDTPKAGDAAGVPIEAVPVEPAPVEGVPDVPVPPVPVPPTQAPPADGPVVTP
ncbi:MAG: hypothetical protein Q8P18_03595 [Pseudomonadota bacterium]|nr:hypothetical protein [Pseudomonadota bacterium]